MNRSEAHELLNAAQAGADVTETQITEALMATGDVDESEYPVIHHKPVGCWERKHQGLAPAKWFEVVA
jgi:hypothetical protein